jgi:hypothetical protein
VRLPAFSPGVTAFLWALLFAVYIWLGGLMVGLANGVAVIVAVVLGFGIFIYIRIYGEDEPRRV